MRFSICIPNYNYAGFIARTIQSALDQTHGVHEVLVADNASTDGSVGVVSSFTDARVRLRVNACNVGFARNLDKAALGVSGDMMIMLSSDDVMRPSALTTYVTALNTFDFSRTVVTSSMDKIDPDDAVTGYVGPDQEIWKREDKDDGLSTLLGVDVYRVSASALLRRCLLTMKNPFNFAATAYPRALYEQLEGYGGGRLINPDKWFHWRLLTVATDVLFIDAPLFGYRWHPANQSAIQSKQGALKYLLDEYASTIEVDDGMLAVARVTRPELIAAFVERDIAMHGLATLAKGDRTKAKRVFDFGRAVYPAELRQNQKAALLRVLVASGRIGRRAANLLYEARRRIGPRDL